MRRLRLPGRPAMWFVALFILLTGAQTACFYWQQNIFRTLVLTPVSRISYWIIDLLLPAVSLLPANTWYDLYLPGQVLRINFGCTGIFALFILIAAVLAYPAGWKAKLRGFCWMIPVFYLYSILRIVIMGLVGAAAPDSLDFVHSYLMEIVNIGVMLGIYVWWVERQQRPKLANTAG
jgi:exosortase/archaeosortase family protein